MSGTRIGDLCALNYGKALRNYEHDPKETLLVRVFGTNGPIGWTSSPLYDRPTIIIGRKGAYRGVHFTSIPSWTIDTAYYLTLLTNDVDLKWLYYRLLIVDINRMDTGSAIPSTKREDFYSISVRLPPLNSQQRIASILSAYDDLIENSRRRIQLLELSARLLYKEWFVHLRFPGHEHVKIKNGVPEGWKRETLANLCESVKYGYTASSKNQPVGPKYLRITDIVPPIIDWSTVPYCEIADDKKEKVLLRTGDIVVARTGATVGYAKRIHKQHPETVFASYLVRLRPCQDVDNYMLGVFVESDEYKAYINAHVGGAAQPNANAKVISGEKVLVPSASLQQSYRSVAEPLLDQRDVLIGQIEKLQQARDLLLPRLMNGEVVV